MSDLAQILSTIVAVVIGYAFGVYHTRRALRDVLDRLKREGKL
jgi:heme exporter protein D